MAKAEGAKPKAKPTGKKSPAANDGKPQSERFIETARMLEADESSVHFEKAFDELIIKQARLKTP